MFLAYIHTNQLPLPLTYFWHSRAVRKLFTPLGTNMFFTLTNHPHLRGRDHKYTYVIVKQRGVSRIRESFFFSNRVVNLWNSLPVCTDLQISVNLVDHWITVIYESIAKLILRNCSTVSCMHSCILQSVRGQTALCCLQLCNYNWDALFSANVTELVALSISSI